MKYRPRVRARMLAAAWVAVLASSCEPTGHDAINRLTTWEAGDYRVRYLDPPWSLVEETREGAFFQIESNLMNFAGLDGGTGKYDLRTSRVRGPMANAMAAETRAASTTEGRSIVAGPRPITTLEGVAGQELLTFDVPDPFERYRRVVLLPLPSGQLLRLEFEATPDLDTAEGGAMIQRVGIGPL